MNDWNIQSRAHQCETCAKAFEDQQPYHTLLLDEKQEYRRLDVCEYCWQTQFAQSAREQAGFVSHWQGTYEAPPPPGEDPIQKENAESLLRKIIEQNDDKYVPAAYILAVMLERKRLLKVKEQIRRAEGRVFVYEQPKTGDVFTILDPELRLDQLEQVQHDVAGLLEHGLNPIVEPTDAARSEVETSGSVSDERSDELAADNERDDAAQDEPAMTGERNRNGMN